MEDIAKIEQCINELEYIISNIRNPGVSINVRPLLIQTTNIVTIIEKYDKNISERINLILHKGIIDNYGRIVLFDLGRLFELLIECKNIIENNNFWKDINPKIATVTKAQFLNKDYLACIRNSVIEINTYLKKLYKEKRNKELDGTNLMGAVFSKENPLIELDDLETEDGVNIQQGFQKISEGAIQAGRNPFAHTNRKATESEAKHYIYLSSLIMNKIDEGKIKE